MEERAKRPSEVVAKQVLTWRRRRNLSVQAVADRVAQMGGSLSRMAISRIENGNRSVSLDEWLQLAHALAVPPPLLFLDLQEGEPVRIGEEVVIYPWLAWQWVAGQVPPVLTNRTVTHVEEWHQALNSIRLYTDQGEATKKIENALSNLRTQGFINQGVFITERASRGQLVEGLRELASALDEMIEVGMTPPAKPADWIEAIRALGVSRHPDALRSFGEPSGAQWVAEITGPTISTQQVAEQMARDAQEGRGDGER